MTRPRPVIAIDGPSGSGKGTISRRVAEELGFHLLDSGALYRLLACAAQRDGAGLDDAAALADLAGRIEGEFTVTPDGTEVVLLDGADVTDVLRTEATGNAASRLAALPEVRTALLAWQRRFRRLPGLVADGRDMGTVVFPDAGLKVFLTAVAVIDDLGAIVALLRDDELGHDRETATAAAYPAASRCGAHCPKIPGQHDQTQRIVAYSPFFAVKHPRRY